eukprot:COSAG02_NODE_18_length_54986_cov_345.599322_13_plen_98_part_00
MPRLHAPVILPVKRHPCTHTRPPQPAPFLAEICPPAGRGAIIAIPTAVRRAMHFGFACAAGGATSDIGVLGLAGWWLGGARVEGWLCLFDSMLPLVF